MKKLIAVTCLAIAATGVFAGAAHSAPAGEFKSGTTPVSLVQADPVALTPEQQAYCRNISMSGLAGMAIGSAVGFPFFVVGAFPGMIIGGLAGGASGSSSPMPDDTSGQTPFVRCSMG